MGYVTRFEIAADYALQFPEKVVGASKHRELWVSAGDLVEFNRHIIGKISVIREYRAAANSR